jgi:oligopeptide/dipeptide ABC transporter ATP-binding protein
MYAGYIVENGPVRSIFKRTGHPYTLGLLGSLPRLDMVGKDLLSVPGQPPNQLALPPGCPFAVRCSFATETCESENPALEEMEKDHWVACWEKDRVRGEG